jgi:hypothetical protein
MTHHLRMLTISLLVLFVLPGRLAAMTEAAGEDAGKPAETDPLQELLEDAEDCIPLNRIRRTEVIDEQTIVFELSGGERYANRLPHRCPGLRRNKAIMYKTSLSKLCSVDLITVLDNMGFGFSRGASCGLGSFVPVSEATVKLLRESQ